MSKKVISLIVLIIAIISWNVLVALAENKLENREYKDIYSNNHKVWNSRGLYDKKTDRNSISAIQHAFDNGALGVEFDFHYDVRTDRFIVSHDHPSKNADGTLKYVKKDGKLLTMQELFQSLNKSNQYFWLDYKNLDKLSTQETKKSIQRLLYITKENNIQERLYIEGSNPLNLPMYTDAGFKTILGIFPLRESYPFSSLVINAYKIAFAYTNISALAFAYGEPGDQVYGENAEKSLGNIPIFLFHLPHNEELLQNLVYKENVKVILMESLTGIDRNKVGIDIHKN